MKKVIATLLLFTLIFGVSSCGTANDDTLCADVTVDTLEETMKVIIGDTTLEATLVDNSSSKALVELLNDGPITIDMMDYGNMEKVGGLGSTLPTNDERITAQPCDIILYQANAIVIYYEPNTWSFTKLGTINGVTKSELKDILGDGNVTVTLSL